MSIRKKNPTAISPRRLEAAFARAPNAHKVQEGADGFSAPGVVAPRPLLSVAEADADEI